jgi:hypothetical protein
VKNIKWYLVRRWLYGVIVAGGALAVAYGLIDAQAVPLIAAVVLALFNTRPPAVPGEPADAE